MIRLLLPDGTLSGMKDAPWLGKCMRARGDSARKNQRFLLGRAA
jgi:hypothetical protein